MDASQSSTVTEILRLAVIENTEHVTDRPHCLTLLDHGTPTWSLTPHMHTFAADNHNTGTTIQICTGRQQRQADRRSASS